MEKEFIIGRKAQELISLTKSNFQAKDLEDLIINQFEMIKKQYRSNDDEFLIKVVENVRTRARAHAHQEGINNIVTKSCNKIYEAFDKWYYKSDEK